MDQQCSARLDGERWVLGPLARILTAPLTGQAERVLNSRALEVAFLTGSWSKQHALLAVLDRCQTQTSDVSESTIAEVQADWLLLRPEDFVGQRYGGAIRGLCGAFHKLAQSRADRSGSYRKLIEVLLEAGLGARAIAQSSILKFAHIEALAAAPDWFRSEAIMELPPHRVEALTLIARSIARNASPLDAQRVRKIQKLAVNGDLANDLLEAGINLPFIAAPEPLDSRLRQVRSVKALRSVGMSFRNCVSDYAQQCVDGVAAYYVWQGDERAVVQTQKIMGTTWIIGDIRGPANRGVSEETRQLIRRSLPRDDDDLIYDGAWPENLFL